jgi:hypothetical protein
MGKEADCTDMRRWAFGRALHGMHGILEKLALDQQNGKIARYSKQDAKQRERERERETIFTMCELTSHSAFVDSSATYRVNSKRKTAH